MPEEVTYEVLFYALDQVHVPRWVLMCLHAMHKKVGGKSIGDNPKVVYPHNSQVD